MDVTPATGDGLGLSGKVAIVTGGGAAGDGIGNGRAAAILLARAGAKVLVVDRQVELAQRTVDMIAAEGGTSAAFAADVTDEDQCRAMVDRALALFARLDLLDNNVGIDGKGTVVDEDPQRWRRIMQVNVDSMFLASRHAIPAMIKTAGAGAIVNVASIAALRPRGMTAYSTSKGAVIALTRAMAVDHGPQGIRVNCVAPGPVYTPMVFAAGMSPAARERRREASVLGVEGTGWDIGYAIRFLLSDQARFITGQTLVVDGGTTLVGRPPMEDAYLGKATERLFLPLLRVTLPEIVDMNLPVHGVFHNLAIISIKKEYPAHGRKVMHALWGLGQMMFTKTLIVVDHDVNVHDLAEVTWVVGNNIEPKRDAVFSDGPVDVLDHAAPVLGYGSKLGLDATRKWRSEGFERGHARLMAIALHLSNMRSESSTPDRGSG